LPFSRGARANPNAQIKTHAFSGGRATKEEHERLGADIDVDVSYQYLRFFMEDDEELEKVRRALRSRIRCLSAARQRTRRRSALALNVSAQIGTEYRAGRMMSGEVKKRLIEVLTPMIMEHQRRRALVTDDVVRRYTTERPLEF